jgi:hypothetical protein
VSPSATTGEAAAGTLCAMSTLRVTLVAATLLAAVPGLADAATKRTTCHTLGGATVAASDNIRVFSKRGMAGTRTLSSCRRGSRASFTLAWQYENERWYGVAIGGDRYVAVSQWRWAPVDGIREATVNVYDTRTHRRVRAGGLPGPDGRFALGMDPPQRGQLVLTADGVAAYLTGNDEESGADGVFRPAPEGVVRLVVLDRDGPRVIDAAGVGEGGVSDLALAGSRLYWLHGDEPRSTTI